MLSVEEALSRILAEVPRLQREAVPLSKAGGRVLAEPVKADRDLPAFRSSARDGYAVRSTDTVGAGRITPRSLSIMEEIPAGRVPTRPVRPGEASRIFTGAVIPEGADAVVQQEDTERAGTTVRVFAAAEKGDWIRPAGEEFKKGEEILAAGRRMRPADVGMLAMVGRPWVRVGRQPRVAILATGDEVVEPRRPVKVGQVRNANSYSLAAAVRPAGGIPVLLGIARDRMADLVAKLRRALREDLLLVSAGVSVGEHDLVKDGLAKVGVELNFWQVAMKPGRPLAFGLVRLERSRKVPVFALPGNPVSALVTFELFVKPAMRAMMGEAAQAEAWVRAVLLEDLPGSGRRSYTRVVFESRNGRLAVRTTGNQDSHLLSSLVKADGLVAVPENTSGFKAGDEVYVIPF